jgi:hypothetical protein
MHRTGLFSCRYALLICSSSSQTGLQPAWNVVPKTQFPPFDMRKSHGPSPFSVQLRSGSKRNGFSTVTRLRTAKLPPIRLISGGGSGRCGLRCEISGRTKCSGSNARSAASVSLKCRICLVPALKSGKADDGKGRRLLGRNTLVIAQVAGALLLLVFATQAYRGASIVISRPAGFCLHSLFLGFAGACRNHTFRYGP